MMMEYYRLKAEILGERSRFNEKNQNSVDITGKLNFAQKDETKTRKWTKRTLEKRLKYHTQIGFAADHFDMIDQLETVQSILVQKLRDESSKVTLKKISLAYVNYLRAFYKTSIFSDNYTWMLRLLQGSKKN